MMIESISVGTPTKVRHNGKTVQTSIFKTPVAGPVTLRLHNLEGDRQADLEVHGGRDKAVYAYATEHYAFWTGELGKDHLEPAAFGENLAVSGMLEPDVKIGSRYRMGTAEVIVSQPRLPCFKLGIRMNDASFPNRFLQSGRLGFYLRVEIEGVLQAGDEIVQLESNPKGISVDMLWRAVFSKNKNAEVAERALESLPYLDSGWRRRLQAVVANKQNPSEEQRG